MHVVTVSSQKGGTGKTTTAVTLAHALAIKGYCTLIIDLDPQGQVASSLGRNHEAGVFNWLALPSGTLPLSDVVRTTGRTNLLMIPGDKSTSAGQVLLNHYGKTVKALVNKRPELEAATLDFVIVDTAPSVGGLQEAALLASDLVVVPTATDYLSTEGVVGTVETLTLLRNDHGWRGRALGVLPTFYDEVTKESAATLADLRETFGPKMLLRPIHRATILRECSAEGLTVWEKAPEHRAAQEYADLVGRVEDAAA
jgi:chromosome partitioning protein